MDRGGGASSIFFSYKICWLFFSLKELFVWCIKCDRNPNFLKPSWDVLPFVCMSGSQEGVISLKKKILYEIKRTNPSDWEGKFAWIITRLINHENIWCFIYLISNWLIGFSVKELLPNSQVLPQKYPKKVYEFFVCGHTSHHVRLHSNNVGGGKEAADTVKCPTTEKIQTEVCASDHIVVYNHYGRGRLLEAPCPQRPLPSADSLWLRPLLPIDVGIHGSHSR